MSSTNWLRHAIAYLHKRRAGTCAHVAQVRMLAFTQPRRRDGGLRLQRHAMCPSRAWKLRCMEFAGRQQRRKGEG
eukprot:6214737-Pleurochrysis_carterae.AAC.2